MFVRHYIHETRWQHVLICRSFALQQWELLVLQVLGWDLSAVTPYSILDHLLRSLSCSAVVRKHAETFVALAATEHSFCRRSPAVVAVACLGAALRGLNAAGLEEKLAALQGITGVDKVKAATHTY